MTSGRVYTADMELAMDRRVSRSCPRCGRGVNLAHGDPGRRRAAMATPLAAAGWTAIRPPRRAGALMLYITTTLLLVNVAQGLTYRTPNGTAVHSDTPYAGTDPLHDGVQDGVLSFTGDSGEPNYFKVTLIRGDHLLVGARNVVYNVSLDADSLALEKTISWPPTPGDIKSCSNMIQDKDHCHNYIRVLAQKSDNEYVVCGTNAYKPWCRTYRQIYDGYEAIRDEDGRGYCPYDHTQNNTAVLVDGSLFAGTVADISGRDALLYRQPVRTEHYDSQMLNDPSFVNSFEYEDKVYFVFREVAVEYINCGKRVYSRVARVCKNDEGAARDLIWTSFFKVRLNCSIPGEFPFYFDEIQSATERGRGHYRPTLIGDTTHDMFYAVFNTPENSISGSAVCAFTMRDLFASFEGQFKEQKTAFASWLPVRDSDVPQPHPAKHCHNNSKNIPDQTMNFIKMHPLMDRAVPAFGGKPLLVQASFTYRMTRIAVDWQYRAVDGRKYDILYIGTDDGRVIKAVNKNMGDKIETVIIEDLQVFEDQSAIEELRVYRNNRERLIVVSKETVKSLPLHRCHLQTSCSGCIALQDPYCSWVVEDELCRNVLNQDDRNSGEFIQNVETGKHSVCKDTLPSTTAALTTTPPSTPPAVGTTTPQTPPCQPCTCSDSPGEGVTATPTTTPKDNGIAPPLWPGGETTTRDNHIPQLPEDLDPAVGASVGEDPGRCTVEKMAIAVVVSIIAALSGGFIIGFVVSQRCFSRDGKCLSHDGMSGVGVGGMNQGTVKVPNTCQPEGYANTNTYVTSPPFPEKTGVKIYHNPTKDMNNAKVRNTNLSGSIEAVGEPHIENSKKVYV